MPTKAPESDYQIGKLVRFTRPAGYDPVTLKTEYKTVEGKITKYADASGLYMIKATSEDWGDSRFLRRADNMEVIG